MNGYLWSCLLEVPRSLPELKFPKLITLYNKQYMSYINASIYYYRRRWLYIGCDDKTILPNINKYLQPAPDQHGFRPEHSTTSALLQMTTYIAMGFNQRNPPDRTIRVAVDLSTVFDTAHHNNPICCQRSTDHSSHGHSAMAIPLSKMKTSQDMLQAFKVNV